MARDYLHTEPRREDFARIVGLGKSGVADVSEDHDRHIGEAISRG